MKPLDLKRAVFVLSVFCMCLFLYLYWQQQVSPSSSSKNGNSQSSMVYAASSELHQSTSNRAERQTTNNRTVEQLPSWTWHCINQRCERHKIHNQSQLKVSTGKLSTIPAQIQSLATCNMLCGSTQLWPQPTGRVTLGSKSVTFHPKSIRFNSDQLDKLQTKPLLPILQAAFNVFRDSVNALNNTPQSYSYFGDLVDISEIWIVCSIQDPDVIQLRLNTSEEYSLGVRPDEGNSRRLVVKLTAKTFFGARHGLETLSQLIWWDDYTERMRILRTASIQDAPLFSYRGIMVDTARNYMSMMALRRVITAMAANKLNVFHWHVTDSQSFPLEIIAWPQFLQYGAYSPQQIYTQREIREFVEFARVRGVRVIIEMDAPAHAGNGWNFGVDAGLGALAVCVNAQPWSVLCGEPPCGQLNPHNAYVYDILETIYRQILELTGDSEIFHLGGDEVNLECWAQNLTLPPPATQTNSSSGNNNLDLHELWAEFTLKAMERLRRANGNHSVDHVVLWSSPLTQRPLIGRFLANHSSDLVVQVWGGSQWTDAGDLLADGYSVILSHVDAWYLDCGFGRWRETGDAACDPYRTWQTVYSHRPWRYLSSWKRRGRGNPGANRIFGAEVCLWTEQVTESALDARLWPRAAAFAERIWADPSQITSDVEGGAISEDVYTRLNTQRERMVGRGVAADAIWPHWCVHNPGMCL